MVFLLQKNKEPEVGVFVLTEYQWEIEHYPLDKNVGQVDDKYAAIEKAMPLWLEWSEKYGFDDGQTYQDIYEKFIKRREFEVAYDSKEKCWHIYGTFQPNTFGGIPHSIIRENGEVIAVWVDE